MTLQSRTPQDSSRTLAALTLTGSLPLRTFAIITTNANADMTGLHDRMPVILDQADWPAWLGEAEGDRAALLRLAPDGTLRTWPVSTRVNTPRNNDAGLLAPL